MIDATLKSFSPPNGDMEKINRFTRREFQPEEVYAFSVVLCDNEVDRDGECFTQSALRELSRLFIGKTGIFDHNPAGKNQTARIYEAEVVSGETKTRLGETYECLKAKAYMVRNSGNADLIQEIDGGIKKEVSVGCSVADVRCSICGADLRKEGCSHEKGREYNGKLCCHLLDNPTDAYEWSFVAVPAQKNAGVTKGYFGGKEEPKMREIQEICKALQSGGAVTLSGEEAGQLHRRMELLQREARLGSETGKGSKRKCAGWHFWQGKRCLPRCWNPSQKRWILPN